MYQYIQYGFDFFLVFPAICARDGGHRIRTNMQCKKYNISEDSLRSYEGKPVKLSAGNRKTKIGGHGGPRTKGAALEMDWIHEDAKGVSDDLFAVAAQQALGNPAPVTGSGVKPYHSVCDWMAGFIN